MPRVFQMASPGGPACLHVRRYMLPLHRAGLPRPQIVFAFLNQLHPTEATIPLLCLSSNAFLNCHTLCRGLDSAHVIRHGTMYQKRSAGSGSAGVAERPQKRPRAKLPPPPTNPQAFTRRHWTPKEDEALKAAMADIVPHRWKLIAERVPGRDHIQCLQRWQKVLDPSLVKGFWTAEEDQIVIAMKEKGCTSWVEMARAVRGRNPKQVRPNAAESCVCTLPRRSASICSLSHSPFFHLAPMPTVSRALE